jgi:hypothetical protein
MPKTAWPGSGFDAGANELLSATDAIDAVANAAKPARVRPARRLEMASQSSRRQPRRRARARFSICSIIDRGTTTSYATASLTPFTGRAAHSLGATVI